MMVFLSLGGKELTLLLSIHSLTIKLPHKDTMAMWKHHLAF